MKQLTATQKVELIELLPELDHIDAMQLCRLYGSKNRDHPLDWHIISDYLVSLSHKGLLSEVFPRIDRMTAYKLG